MSASRKQDESRFLFYLDGTWNAGQASCKENVELLKHETERATENCKVWGEDVVADDG